LKVALVHDWLTGYRGGERVLHHLACRFPDADLFTLVHEPGCVPREIESRRIFTSPLDRLPGRASHYRKLLPLFPWAIRRFDLTGYDLVLSTSHAVAKSVRIPKGVAHVDYCFTPMRYVWDHVDTYLGSGLKRFLAQPLVAALRRFDARTSGEESVTRFVAISTDVASRIQRHYGRSAQIVPPPIDLSWIETASDKAEDYYLLVGGFVPYKREDLAIEAFRRLDRRLIIVGDGPTRGRLERDAPSNVEFTGRVDEPTLARHYRSCRALLYPQHEDFGLVAVEAQGAGRPVIGLAKGGLIDTVRPLESADSQHLSDPAGPTGVFFAEQTPAALCEAIERFEKAEHLFVPQTIRLWAERFSPARFDEALDREIEMAMRQVQ
jgi:glycosyltransferase involved in cell wall biosynthesis